ncbi:MAG: ABC transporter permease subunit [Rhodospirillaceae bacterium]
MRLALSLGLAFLYAPILVVIAWSFNDSRLFGAWSGFSLRWYAALARDRAILDAALLSVGIAAAAATIAAILGTAAALALARYGRFRTRAALSALLLAPLVMPEVVTGLSLLLLFVALEAAVGWPAGRGATTIVLAHATFGIGFVAVVVRARLAGLDRDLEAAAADLGARPAAAFRLVVLPLIVPAVGAGWLLAFTLSFDDLVIASFVSGPGSSTLPMVIFSSVRLGLSPEINALASVIVVAVSAVALAAAWLLARQDRARRAAATSANTASQSPGAG